MSPLSVADELRGNAFFDGLPEALLWHLARVGERVAYGADELLFREGDARAFFWVVVEGSVAIERTDAEGDGTAVRLAVFSPGSMLAEGSLLDDTPHGSSARATQPTTVIRFATSKLKPLFRDRPPLHAALISRAAKAISERLRSADAMLAGGRRGPGFGGATRIEHDFLGERAVPEAALYGVQTMRAMENFPITGVPLADFPELIVALAQVKEAAVRANVALGLLDTSVGDAIVNAAREIQQGRHHEHFRVDMIQGGAGTSTSLKALTTSIQRH